MKNTKKKLLLTSALVSVCSCFALVACGDETTDPTPTPEKFDAPTNVTVNVNTLSWSEVTGATNGYTVKINSDETTTVAATSLDLTTVTEKLEEGENTLSVKVNATSDKLASAYSATVEYNYTVSGGPQKFDAPTITITGDTLSWNTITGAVKYTVKINTDETTETEETSLDLTTVTAKLVSGDNTIAVKVNAVDGVKLASDYSEPETYNYAPAVEKEAEDYNALVEAIGSITADSTAAEANAVKAAITAAENKYAGMSAEAKELEDVIADKAAFDEKKGAFDEVYEPAKAAYDEFVEALDDATAEITKAESISALTEAKTAAEAKYDALNALAQSMLTTEESTAYAALDTTVTEWTANISNAVTALTYTFPEIENDDEQAEANIAKAAELKEIYDDYAAYIKADADVAAKLAAIDAADTAAKAQLQDTVDALKEQLPAGGTQTLTKEYYQTLTALKAEIDALGDYAASIWSADDTAKVVSEMTRVETTPVETLGGETYSISGTTLKVTVFRTFINCLGNKIAAEDGNAPTLAVTGNNVTVEQQFTKNALNEYVAVINIENTAVMGEDASYTVSLGSSDTTKPLSFGEVLGNNPYFTNTDTVDGFKSAFDDQGNFTYTIQGGCEADHYYLDMYIAGAVQKDGAFVKYTQMPLGTIEIKSKVEDDGESAKTVFYIEDLATPITMDKLQSYLARNFGDVFIGKGEMSVRFAIYGTKKDGDTVSFTAYNASVISGAIAFDITEDDLLTRVPFNHKDGALSTRADGSFICGSAINYNDLMAAFGLDSANDVRDQIRYHVTIYKDGVEQGDFYASIPGDATLDAATMKRNIYRFCGETAATDNITYTVALALINDSEYASTMRESQTSPQKDWKFNGTGFAATAADARFTGGTLHNVVISETEAIGGTIAYGSYEWATDNGSSNIHNDYFHDYHDGLALLIFDATDVENADTYDFVANGVKPFAVYTHTGWSEITWSSVNAEIDNVWRKLPVGTRKSTMKFVFATQIIANEDGKAMGFMDSLPKYCLSAASGPYAVVTYTRDFRLSGGTLNNVAINTTETTTGNIAYGDWQWANDNGEEGNHKNYYHDYHDGLAVLIFDATEVENADTYDFVANGVTPFAIYTHRTWGDNMSWAKINAEIDKVWAALPAAQKKNTMKFVFATQVIVNEAGIEAGYESSAPHYFVDNSDSAKHAVVTYERDFSTPTNNLMVIDGGFLLPVGAIGNMSRGELIYNETYGVQYIEVKITIYGKDYLAYIMLDDDYNGDEVAKNRKMGMYISLDKSGERLNLDYAANGWCNYSEFVDFVNANKAYFGLAGAGKDGADLVFTDADAVEFRTKVVHDGTYFTDAGDYSDPVGKNLPTTEE